MTITTLSGRLTTECHGELLPLTPWQRTFVRVLLPTTATVRVAVVHPSDQGLYEVLPTTATATTAPLPLPPPLGGGSNGSTWCLAPILTPTHTTDRSPEL